MSFSYDAAGQRYKSVDSSSGEYTYYLNSLMEMREGTSTSPGTPTYYIFAGGQRVAMREGTGANVIYNHQDHLGGTALTTDSAGGVNQIYDYYPYGEELENTLLGTVDAAHSFTDKELDDSLGLYYFEARWYSPSTGRFASGDPMQFIYDSEGKTGITSLLSDPQSLNFYSYSRNNPIVYVDPNGEAALKIEQLRQTISLMLSGYYQQTGNYWTTVLMQHSLQDNPRGLHFDGSTNLVKQIKNSDEYKTSLNASLLLGVSEGETSGRFDLAFESGDLNTSIGKASGLWEITEAKDGQYQVSIYMIDQYNFEIDKNYDNTLLSTVNNSAVVLEEVGVINEYAITANFTDTITLTDHKND